MSGQRKPVPGTRYFMKSLDVHFEPVQGKTVLYYHGFSSVSGNMSIITPIFSRYPFLHR